MESREARRARRKQTRLHRSSHYTCNPSLSRVTNNSLSSKIIFRPLDTPVQARPVAHLLVMHKRSHPPEIADVFVGTPVDITGPHEIRNVVTRVRNIFCAR